MRDAKIAGMPRLRRQVVSAAKNALASRGYELARIRDPYPDERTIIDWVRPFTMASDARIAETCAATRYVVENQVPGALVECGVWKGGNAMAMALQLLAIGDTSRGVWLYDTFAGMTEPTVEDKRIDGAVYNPMNRWQVEQNGNVNTWAYAPLAAVKEAVGSTGYPGDDVRYVVGPVEDTIPDLMPDRIAVLRLDTDWYASTKHELDHLFPLLEPGGVLIIDDYGTWGGCRKAVDEYIAAHDLQIFLQRTDESGRAAVKQA